MDRRIAYIGGCLGCFGLPILLAGIAFSFKFVATNYDAILYFISPDREAAIWTLAAFIILAVAGLFVGPVVLHWLIYGDRKDEDYD